MSELISILSANEVATSIALATSQSSLQSAAPHSSLAAWPLSAAQELYVPVLVGPPFPKFGLRSLHAATTCGSICGKALVACFR